MRKIAKTGARTLIRFYQLAISPLNPPACRFAPTCSYYALEAIERHGALKGLFLALRRILRCHPWHRKNFNDPVPEKFIWAFARPRLIRYKRGQDKPLKNIKKQAP